MFDKGEMGLLQKVNRSEKSICPNCFHYGLCMGEYNQPCFECNGFLDANAVTIKKWIPVSERLPKEDGSYLVTTKTGTVTTARFYVGKTYPPTHYRPTEYTSPTKWQSNRHVTHWMPLPEPPKED